MSTRIVLSNVKNEKKDHQFFRLTLSNNMALYVDDVDSRAHHSSLFIDVNSTVTENQIFLERK